MAAAALLVTMVVPANGAAAIPDLEVGTFLPTDPPSNGQIAFYSSRDGSDNIYVMNADGSGQTRLTFAAGHHAAPSWSPDGARLAFHSTRDGGNSEIYVMNADGTDQTRLTVDPASDAWAAWSPDGTQIAFNSNRDGDWEIYVMNADGTNQTPLTVNTSVEDYPAWSPDGTQISFTSNRDGNWEIYVMDADGTDQTRLTNDGAHDTKPAWSPDGTHIAFQSNAYGGDFEIFTMSADGSGQIRLTDTFRSTYPTWSPDGTQIAFASFVFGANGWEIFTMNADGSNPVNRTVAAGGDFGPAWGVEDFDPCGVTQSLTLNNASSPPPSPLFGLDPVTGSHGAGPYGVAVDAVGNIYAADPTSNRTYRFDPTGGQTLAVNIGGNGDGIAADGAGNIYVGNELGSFASFIRKLAPDGTVLGTLSGNNSGDNFYGPRGIAVDEARELVYFGQTRSGVFVTDPGLTEARLFIDDTAADPDFNGVGGVALDDAGNIYVAGNYIVSPGSYSGIVYKFSPAGDQLWTLQDPVLSRGTWGVAVDSFGNVYVSDDGTGGGGPDATAAVYGFHPSGERFLTIDNSSAPVPSPAFEDPHYIAVDDSGHALYVSDRWSRTIYRFDVPCNQPPNTSPVVTVDAAVEAVDEGQQAVNGGTVGDSDDDLVTLSASVGAVTNNGDGTWSWSFDTSDGPDQSQTVTIDADDGNGGTAQTSFELVVLNVAPTVSVHEGAVAADEGQPAVNSGSFDDVGDDTVTVSASIGTVTQDTSSWSWTFDAEDGPHQSDTVTVTATDSDGAEATATFELTVDNVAPTVDGIVAPLEPVAIESQPVNVTATFSDPAGTADEPYTCSVDYGDGAGDQPGTVSGTECTGPGQTYADAGVYTVTVAVTDKDGGTGSAVAADYVVIYDPAGGFVTGGGWIDSPPGAYAPDPSLTGKANFGFVSKYKKGANAPTGNTEFQFRAADMEFHSDSYDWLVIAGKTRAKYKGAGTINGSGNYGFMLTAVDDDSGDTFRIKIWDNDAGDTVVYDNQAGAPDDGHDGTVIGGGNITVHTKA